MAIGLDAAEADAMSPGRAVPRQCVARADGAAIAGEGGAMTDREALLEQKLAEERRALRELVDIIMYRWHASDRSSSVAKAMMESAMAAVMLLELRKRDVV